ncbi:PASTA domain-containing protein [Acidicapsa ligni]|uniref:PASTA domain-containing protein n=1 Tax=Acidicapsa ligni TaxID=542300 RepID=UPI0021DF9057|nr:PASTA domain-containing protein [Acidicapsa ligni]
MKIKLQPIQNFFQGASILLGLVLVALLSAVTTMHFAIHGREVRVPVLKDMTVAEARSQTAGLGLDLEVDNRYYSADVAAGHILSQSPIPGSVVRREWRVRVSESLGPQKVEVPSVLGNEERMASLNLRRVGLESGATAQLPYSGAAPGTVLAQDPPPKAQGIERPSVNLLIAASDDTVADGFVMPDLTGLPVLTAQGILSRVGIKYNIPNFVDVPGQPIPSVPPVSAISTSASAPAPVAPANLPKPPVQPGVVVSQQPPVGYRIEVGSSVTLNVAK